MQDEIIWLLDERVFGVLLARGAYFSIVQYSRGGIDYEVLIENEEYIFREEDDPVDPE